jgi:hypothetical protein
MGTIDSLKMKRLCACEVFDSDPSLYPGTPTYRTPKIRTQGYRAHPV